jgi:hypothetical protein
MHENGQSEYVLVRNFGKRFLKSPGGKMLVEAI